MSGAGQDRWILRVVVGFLAFTAGAPVIGLLVGIARSEGLETGSFVWLCLSVALGWMALAVGISWLHSLRSRKALEQAARELAERERAEQEAEKRVRLHGRRTRARILNVTNLESFTADRPLVRLRLELERDDSLRLAPRCLDHEVRVPRLTAERISLGDTVPVFLEEDREKTVIVIGWELP